jgi:hypothetical protein
VITGEDYIADLRKKAKESKVYQKHQLIGLQVAEILNDNKHKALYIKLAKEKNTDRLLEVARAVAERANIKNPGAYFMRIITSNEVESKYKKDNNNTKSKRGKNSKIKN